MAQTILTNNSKIRKETEQVVIDNLKRKGWTEVTVPSYDPATQNAPEWNGTAFVSTNLTTEQLAAISLKQKQAAFDATIAAEFPVPGTNYSLKLDDAARNLFTGLATMVHLGLTAGAITNDTEQVITDKDNVQHTLKVSELIPVLLGYGSYYTQAFQTLYTA